MKKFGVRGTLPDHDPMRKAHLLGENWEWHRWYETAAERDEALAEMLRKHPYYRVGDYASQVLSKVER
ncbi:MAG: hypothetical protein U1F68_00595 [Gammaproteobacteria bacterium]